MGKSRESANLVSDNNIFVDVSNDRVGIGSTIPTSKLSVTGDARVSGVLTSSTLSVTSNATISGVVTASSFRGSSQIGISTNGTYVGLATQINFVGLGVTTSTNTITVNGTSRAKSYFYGAGL